MRWYHVGMTLVDVAFLCNMHFWTGYSMAAFVDQSLPAAPRKRDTNDGRVLGEVVGQLVLMACFYVVLVPIMGQLTNPMWRVVKETPRQNEPFKPYKPTLAAGKMESTFFMLGMVCGSPNFVTKTRMLNHLQFA